MRRIVTGVVCLFGIGLAGIGVGATSSATGPATDSVVDAYEAWPCDVGSHSYWVPKDIVDKYFDEDEIGVIDHLDGTATCVAIVTSSFTVVPRSEMEYCLPSGTTDCGECVAEWH